MYTHFSIEEISEVITVSEEKAWQTAVIKPTASVVASIEIEEQVTVPAKLMLEKQSVLMWVVEKVAKNQ